MESETIAFYPVVEDVENEDVQVRHDLQTNENGSIDQTINESEKLDNAGMQNEQDQTERKRSERIRSKPAWHKNYVFYK